MSEQRQAELLELYIAALQRDSSALPPRDLDPATAAFVRQLMAQRSAAQADVTARARVWAKALNAARPPMQVIGEINPRDDLRQGVPDPEDTSVRLRPVQPRETARPITLLVAVLALVVFGVGLAIVALYNQQIAAASAMETATAQIKQTEAARFTATAFPSSTMTATNTVTPSFTPTLVPEAVTTSTPIPVSLEVPTAVPPWMSVPISGTSMPEAASPLPTLNLAYDPTLAQELRIRAEAVGVLNEAIVVEVFRVVVPQPQVLIMRWNGANATPVLHYNTGWGATEDLPGARVGLNSSGTLALPVPSGETLLALASPSGTTAGAYTLMIEPLVAQPLTEGQDLYFTITPEMPFVYLSFTAEMAETVTLNIAGDDQFDTQIQVFDLAGRAQALFDDDGGTGYDPEVYAYPLPVSGNYGVLIAPTFEGDTGTFTLRFEQRSARTLDVVAQQVTLSPKNSPATFTFTAAAGERVRVNVRADENEHPFTVRVEMGDRTLTTFNGTGEISGVVEVPTEGAVRVILTTETDLNDGVYFSTRFTVSIAREGE